MVEDSEGFVFIFSSLALEMLERFIHHLHFFVKVNQFFSTACHFAYIVLYCDSQVFASRLTVSAFFKALTLGKFTASSLFTFHTARLTALL